MRVALTLVLLSVAVLGVGSVQTSDDPFEIFGPRVVLDGGDRLALERHEVVAKTLDAEANELGFFFATRIDVTPEIFVEAHRQPERLLRMRSVPHANRFSTPPTLDDLKAMQLSPRDRRDAQRCRRGDCSLKLTDAEIDRLRAAASADAEVRQVVLDRLRQYLARPRAIAPYHDHERRVDPFDVDARLLRHVPRLSHHVPQLTRWPDAGAIEPSSGVHSLAYWLETTSLPKPTIQVLHVVVAQPALEPGAGAEVVVVSRQVFASHYINGSISVSALLRDANGRRYLAFLNRSHVDGLDGWLGGVRRHFVERSACRHGAAGIAAQRQRLQQWRN